MKATTPGLWALGLLLAAAQASAQSSVYRCGQTYQQSPCAAGQGQAVEVADTRTPAQRQEARAAANADSRQARELAAERKARDKAIRPQTAPMGIAAPRADEAASAADSSKRRKKNKKDDDNPRYWSAPASKGK